MKICNVIVPSGVGDIFWVYQKLYYYFDVINFKVCYLLDWDQSHEIKTRSFDIVKCWDKVDSVEIFRITSTEYNEFISENKTLDIIFKEIGYFSESSSNVYDFRCSFNRFLERGINIEDIDSFKVKQNVKMSLGNNKYLENSLTIFVSGDTTRIQNECWNLYTWYEFILKEHKNVFGEVFDTPIYLIGATYDKDFLVDLYNMLSPYFSNIHLFINLNPPDLFNILKSTKYFIGYQSGLSILADNFDTPQTIVYFNFLRDMRDTWVKPKNRGSIFKYVYF